MKTMDTNFQDDLPKDLALRAFDNVSHDPRGMGERALSDYRNTLEGDYADLLSHANTDEKKAQLEEEFSRFRQGYAKRYTAWLHSASRCMSSFITGPSNFPVDRARKYSKWEHNRSMALHEFRKRALEAIKRALHPEWRPIMAGDDNAPERLKAKIQKAEEFQEQAKLINATIRKAKKGGPSALEAALKVLGLSDETIKNVLTPDYAGRVGVPTYALTNNNANLRRMRQRLEVISRDQAKEATETQGTAARLEDCPAENRVRLFFPGKPSEEVRTLLKSKGFRWSPTIGAWQAYRNHWSMEVAKQVAGVDPLSHTDIEVIVERATP